METNTNTISWLHGLQDYLFFANDTKSKQYVDFLLNLVYANDPIIELNNDVDLVEFVGTLRKYASNDMLDVFHKYYRNNHDPKALQDAFSRGQVQSKIWLATELKKIKTDFSMIYFLAGWFGHLRSYLDIAGINYDMIRNIDIDPIACKISDQIFNIDKINNYKVKSVELDLTDMSWLYRTGCAYKLINYNTGAESNEKTTPDLIINTSAEHFHEDWYHKFMNRPLETDPLFVIQSNNLRDIPDHINSVWSLSEMKKKFPMSRLEYEGELQLQGYKRFMLIGRP
jgi:hypothetical protein